MTHACFNGPAKPAADKPSVGFRQLDSVTNRGSAESACQDHVSTLAARVAVATCDGSTLRPERTGRAGAL